MMEALGGAGRCDDAPTDVALHPSSITTRSAASRIVARVAEESHGVEPLYQADWSDTNQTAQPETEVRMSIPRAGGPWYVTDAGLETELIFRSGFDLPQFAAFPLLDNPRGREALIAYYTEFARIASSAAASLVLAAPTWRANGAWGEAIGYDEAALDRVNQAASN
jgi:hypothetical protein